MQELISIAYSNDASPWVSQTYHDKTRIENKKLRADNQPIACDNFQDQRENKDPFSSISVTQPADWNERRAYDDTNKEASSNETNMLL